MLKTTTGERIRRKDLKPKQILNIFVDVGISFLSAMCVVKYANMQKQCYYCSRAVESLQTKEILDEHVQ